MDDVRLGFFQHLSHTTKEAFNLKALAKLFRHEQLRVASANNFAAFNALDRPSMGIRDLAASHYRNLKHIYFAFRQLSKNRASPSPVETFGVQSNSRFNFWLL